MNETSIPSPSNVSNDSKSTSGFSLALSVVVDAGVVVAVVASVVDDVFVVDRVAASEKKKMKKKVILVYVNLWRMGQGVEA